MGYWLGVDLGTTYTATAMVRDGHVQVVPRQQHYARHVRIVTVDPVTVDLVTVGRGPGPGEAGTTVSPMSARFEELD